MVFRADDSPLVLAGVEGMAILYRDNSGLRVKLT